MSSQKGVIDMNNEIRLGVIESRFADMIWERAPITSTELVKLAERELRWKRTTTHTVIKRLCEKGLFQNVGGTVSPLISREQFYTMQSRQFVNSSFSGSLPAFIAAFTQGASLTPQEAEAIRRMIDEAEEK